jgi:hypothetical protein
MLSFLIQTYGIKNIGMVCITLSIFLAVLMGLKFQYSYKMIPRSILVGAKISMNILLVMQ